MEVLPIFYSHAKGGSADSKHLTSNWWLGLLVGGQSAQSVKETPGTVAFAGFP